MTTSTLRDMAQSIFRQSLADCSIERALARAIKITGEDGSLKLLIDGAEPIDLDALKHIRVVAVGKASMTMLNALLNCLRPCTRHDISGVLNMAKVADIHVLKEMLYTANPMPVSRLASLGIVNHVVPREELEAFTLEIARQIAETSPLVHRIMKEQLRVLSSALHLNPEAYERIQALRREVYDSEDYQEGIKAFREKRKPVFQGK